MDRAESPVLLLNKKWLLWTCLSPQIAKVSSWPSDQVGPREHVEHLAQCHVCSRDSIHVGNYSECIFLTIILISDLLLERKLRQWEEHRWDRELKWCPLHCWAGWTPHPVTFNNPLSCWSVCTGLPLCRWSTNFTIKWRKEYHSAHRVILSLNLWHTYSCCPSFILRYTRI